MRKIIEKLLDLVAIVAVICIACVAISATSWGNGFFAAISDSTDYTAGDGEVTEYFDRVESQENYSKIILGDSVCNQLFNDLQESNEVYCIDGNNRGLTLAGEYLLLKDFLDCHEGVTDAYLVIGIDTLGTYVNTTYSYPYLVGPFAERGMLEDLDDQTLEDIEEIFGDLSTKKLGASLIMNSAMNKKLFLGYIEENADPALADDATSDEGKVTELSIRNLKAMKSLCDAKGVSLHIYGTPQGDNNYRHDKTEKVLNLLAESEVSDLFADYEATLAFYPEEEFGDGIHFGEGFNSREYLNQVIEEEYVECGFFEDLVLE